VQRKLVEHEEDLPQPLLGSYLAAPEHDWALAEVLTRSNDPDFVFYRRRKTDSAATVLAPNAPELQGVLPTLPLVWSPQRDATFISGHFTIPAALRGKMLRLELQSASHTVEPLSIDAILMAGGRERARYWLRPIFYSTGGEEFLTVSVPADADECRYEIRVERLAKEARVTDFRIVVDPGK